MAWIVAFHSQVGFWLGCVNIFYLFGVFLLMHVGDGTIFVDICQCFGDNRH
jgi:hypothetical protein